MSPFHPEHGILDFAAQLGWGQLIRGPLEPGLSALLEPAGRQNHAPQLCWLPDGPLACVWMAGDGEGTAGMSVYLSLLQQDSATWTEPQLISQDPSRSEQNPLLFSTADGTLHLIHTAQNVRRPGDPPPEPGSTFSMQWTARLRHQILLQGQQQWSDASDLLPDPSFCRNPPLACPDGTWLLPIYRSLEAGGVFGHDHSLMLRLDPQGQPLAEPVAVPDSTGRVHGSLVQGSSSGVLLQFFRSRLADRVYRSVSTDHGHSWAPPHPVPLPNNNSSIQAVRLSSGRLALIFNRFGLDTEQAPAREWGEANWPRTRWPLSIALSEDDGLSWPWIRDIDHGEGFCGTANWFANGQLAYPSLLEGQPGDLHIAYSWGGRAAIRYRLLHEQDILGLAPGP